MKVEDLKYVVGKVEENKPAVVRFFSSVCEESVSRLVDEILFLQDVCKPSKIILMINSEGGSVLYGMSAFSTIMSCPIEVDCVIEGIAASMGSVLWAAGDNLYMHDYSLLMIHNPFASCNDSDSPQAKQMVNAFRSQLMTVYTKRFGMAKSQVAKIMDGEEGADGTFFTAKEAVEAGLIPASHVIKTSKQVCEKVKNEIYNTSDTASMRDMMSSIAAEFDPDKLIKDIETIHYRTNNINIQDKITMEENLNFEKISAQLGFSKDAQMADVQSRIGELLGLEANLKTVQDELNDMKIQFAGKETELNNIKSELEKTQASLKEYQDAEAAAREAEIAETIQSAINEGKIEDSAKDEWITMAQSNFELVKKTLATIHGRDKIEEVIATDPTNTERIENTLTDVEKEMQKRIEAKLGKIEFSKF